MNRYLAALTAVLLIWSGTVLAADFNGNGRDDIAVFRPSTGLWAIRGVTRAYFGTAGDIPTPGRWTQNGRDEIAVFRPSTGLWAVQGGPRNYFGTLGDVPLGFDGGGWSQNGNTVYYNRGQVAVGTAIPSPQDIFTVNGGRAYFNNSNYHGVEIAHSAWSALYIHNTPYRGIDIANCGQQFIRAGEENGPTTFAVQSTGQVGIGTAAGGGAKLRVNGGAGFWGAIISSAVNNGTGLYASCDNGTNAYAIHGASTTGYAGYFSGKVHIDGALSKASGSFKIDHPLDPANRYLSHSFAESPDMLNIYNGNIVLDENGEATVELPGYFEALNRDFRYQLTCLGGFAPVYVSEEISGNKFRIAGGTPGLKVSWQVTGIRRDPWAVQNPIVVEEEKPEEERGYYLHPGAYGQPESKSVAMARTRMKAPATE